MPVLADSPNISLYSPVVVFGAFSLARGIIGLSAVIGSPIREGRGRLVLSRLEREDGIVLGLSSVVSIPFGIVMFAEHGVGALVLLALKAAHMLVIGVAGLTVAVGKRLLNSQLKRAPAPSPMPTR